MKNSPIKRTKPLARTGGLSRAVRKRRPVRDTGPSRAVRAAVWKRAGGACESCGMNVEARPRSVQHRVARGMGGTASPAANRLSNLVLLCGTATTPGSCHEACERRDPGMHDRGFWLWSWEDPEATAITPASEHGAGLTVWLTPDGKYAMTPPEGAEAA